MAYIRTRAGQRVEMENTLAHGIGIVFYGFLLWVALNLAYAAWGSRRARPEWVALVQTRFMRAIRIRWLSLALALLIAIQILLVVGMLGISAWTGRPFTFD